MLNHATHVILSQILFPFLSEPLKLLSELILKMTMLLQSSSSPRRVAVPVLVKDGKPCSGSSNQTSSTSSSGQSNADQSRGGQQSAACQSSQAQAQCMANSGLAMAYGRQQTNYQQQCSAYLPLQARAW